MGRGTKGEGWCYPKRSPLRQPFPCPLVPSSWKACLRFGAFASVPHNPYLFRRILPLPPDPVITARQRNRSMLLMNHRCAFTPNMQDESSLGGIQIRYIRFANPVAMPRHFAMCKDGVLQLLAHRRQTLHLFNQHIAMTKLICHDSKSDEPVRGRNSKVTRPMLNHREGSPSRDSVVVV